PVGPVACRRVEGECTVIALEVRRRPESRLTGVDVHDLEPTGGLGNAGRAVVEAACLDDVAGGFAADYRRVVRAGDGDRHRLLDPGAGAVGHPDRHRIRERLAL